MQMQAAAIEQEIRTFITEHFLYGRSEALNDDAPLMGKCHRLYGGDRTDFVRSGAFFHLNRR